MGIMLPMAHIFLNDSNFLVETGIEGSKGWSSSANVPTTSPFFKTPEQIKFYKTWNNLWKTKWQAPFNT